jgi:hypothetical protein
MQHLPVQAIRPLPPLHAKGYRVRAVQNPLTSLPDDIDRKEIVALIELAAISVM